MKTPLRDELATLVRNSSLPCTTKRDLQSIADRVAALELAAETALEYLQPTTDIINLRTRIGVARGHLYGAL